MAMMTASRTTKSKVVPQSKDNRFFARISSTDKRLLEQAATLTGQSVASFVIAQAREAASLIVESPRVNRLDAKESRRLLEALMAPPKAPSPAFKNALKAYRETVVSDVNPRSPKARKS
jgi:uncharacterized protein (DUF1778 family)